MATGILCSFRSLIAVPVLTVITLMGTVTAQDESILERLQRLEDKEAIHSLLERFFEYQETGKREAFANLFAQNGELILRRGHLKGGPKGIMERYRSSDANAKEEAPAEPSRHILSNVHIELDGNNATAVSRWTMLVPLEERNRFRLGGSGRYCDKLVRENVEWKILQRIIYCEVPEGMEPVN